MITVETPFPFPKAYPLEHLGALEKLLFFDIETTGFSGDSSSLYLVGCVWFAGEGWKVTQWFADTPGSEREVLVSFFEFLKGFDTVIHFNGERFDVPYLLKRCQAFQLPYDFSQVSSIDIYRRIKPYGKLLGLENLKQKSIERFLGLHRQDRYSGGELIAVYEKYLATRKTSLYDLLMLHNREDLEGMPLILPILNYPDFFKGGFHLRDASVLTQGQGGQEAGPVLSLRLGGPCQLPAPIEYASQWLRLTASGQELTLHIPLYQGVLKHFYPDYKNYYYLVYEDTAIHKSVGEYVERSAWKKATAQTCYAKKSGLFLPQPVPIWEPALKKEYRHKLAYVEYAPGLFAHEEDLNRYVRAVLDAAISSKNPFQ